MTKRYFLANTATATFVGPNGRIWVNQGAVPFTIERIDISWAAINGPLLADTFYMNWRHVSDFPDISFDGPLSVRPLNYVFPTEGPHFATLYTSGAPGIAIPQEGPLMWSPAPGESTYSFDVSPFGGIVMDSAADDGDGCIEISFTHDFNYNAGAYLISLLISEDT